MLYNKLYKSILMLILGQAKHPAADIYRGIENFRVNICMSIVLHMDTSEIFMLIEDS